LETGLTKYKPRPLTQPREVPTRVLDEDIYPVGGFASISTRGTIESLLHSQLAFMEPAAAARPDLFDIKFVRDELLYYSRDENQFLRRRRTFVFALLPDLARARFKDVDLPTQRIVLTLAVLVVAVRKLTEWLSADALAFEFLFVADGGAQPLAQEEALLTMLFREPIANGTVQLSRVVDLAAAGAMLVGRARRSMCQALVIGATQGAVSAEGVNPKQLVVAGPRPQLISADSVVPVDGYDTWAAWPAVLERLLEEWV
jgi:hypothetical protein